MNASENEITGDYKDYEYVIDDKLNVTIEGKVGVKPKITYELSSTEPQQEEITITVKATISEGEVKSIVNPDNEEIIGNEITYKVTKNGKYTFIAKSSTGTRKKEKINVTNMKISAPDIKITPTGGYPLMKSSGIVATLSKVEIKYEDNPTLLNYYSEDNGTTWNEYKGTIETGKSKIMAKSVVKDNEQIASDITTKTIGAPDDALRIEAYDGNASTEVRGPSGNGVKLTQCLNIDESAYLNKYQIIQNTISQGSGGSPSLYIYFYDIDNKLIGNGYTYNNVGSNYISNIICPYGAKYMKIILAGSSGWGGESSCALKEISVLDDNEAIVSSNTMIYPILKSDGISFENSKIVYIRYPDTYKQQFYKIGEDSQWQTCDKKMKINLTLEDTIYTKGIDKNGNEVEGMNYTAKMESDAILKNAYDGDESTFYLAGNVATRYMEINKSSWGKKLKILSKGYQIVYFLDKDENVLYKDEHRRKDSTYTIPENTTKLKYYFNENGGIYEMMIKD